MRTHLLKQTSIIGREQALVLEPEFDLYRASKVTRLDVSFTDTHDMDTRLGIDMLYEGPARTYRLGLRCDGVRELRLPALAPSLFLPELEVEDVRARQLDGIRFELVSHFDNSFYCACGSISLLFFDPHGVTHASSEG